MADPAALARRAASTVRNAVDYLRGADLADLRPTPVDAVWRSGKVRLLRVCRDRVTAPAPLLIVHSLISKPYIFDLLPGNSVLEWLRDHGHDVYLLEWGETDETDVANDVATYVDDYVRPAIGLARELSAAEHVALLGYCFGGLLSLLALATDRGLPVRDLALVATPVDFHAITALRRATARGLEARHLTDSTGNIPPDLFRRAFRTLRPTNDVAALVTLLERLHDREYARNHHALSRWTDDQIPFPGALAEEMLPIARDNGFLAGTVRVGRRRADFGRVGARVLSFMALRDHLVPPASATPIERLLPNAEVERFEIDSGHVALLVGARAQGQTLPALHEWLTTGPARRPTERSRNGRASATHP